VGLQILVLDDEPVIALDVEQILSEAGARVVGAATIAEALDLARSNSLSAALLDIRVGGELVTPVATTLAGRDIPIVFYSGQVEVDAALREWRKSTFVAKPAPAWELIRALLVVTGRQSGKAAPRSR
jgi:DNA-binding NtrC family response regulator